jgi:isoquinoline 1-oxidoreductase alpha subunit
MQAASLLAKNPRPSKEEIDETMSGNICRCATYQRIRRAIQRAAERKPDGSSSEARPARVFEDEH